MSQGLRPEITEKQQAFISHLTDNTSSSYANITKSLQAAGYKHGRNPEATAIRLLANRRVLAELIKRTGKAAQSSLIRAESAKERIWQELEEALIVCKSSSDMTNRLRVIELMGKFHQLWSDKVTISVETYEKMTSEHLAELRELSKLRLLGSNAEPIQACFETVSVDMDIPDIACDSIEQQDIINNTPVSHETLDVKYSDDNDLQSNESDNANATQQTL
jgi:hypothetical protein